MGMLDLCTAIVRIPAKDALGETMKEIRVWLDGVKIVPVACRTARDGEGYTLTLGFRTMADAENFRAQFR
jgi:hypothetical protein